MTEQQNPDLPSEPLRAGRYTVLAQRDVLTDPGLAQLRRYLPILAVIGAPYAGLGGDSDPINPFDVWHEWRLLASALEMATQLRTESAAPLALARLMPPTARQLAHALAGNGPDAFQVVHIVAYGERDLLYLEDEQGHEAYAVAEHLARLWQPSCARLVVLEGGFSRHIAEHLLTHTSVEAVIGTRRKVMDDNALHFNAHLYAGLAAGATVRAAYRAALSALKSRADGQADRFEFVERDDGPDVTLPLPPPASNPGRPILADGLPRTITLPRLEGFVGRREELSTLAQAVSAPEHRLFVLHGAAGVGKSRLAAEFTARFGWRFTDGVVWFEATPLTAVHEIAAQLAHLLDLPPHTPPEAVIEALRARRVLLVVDGIDVLEPGEGEWLIALLDGIDPQSGSRAMVTTRDVPQSVRELDGVRLLELTPLPPRLSRTLAMRLAVALDVDALDVDTIDEFLEHTHDLPWLIVRGVELIAQAGLPAALEDLATYRPDRPNPELHYVGPRVQALALEAGRLLALLLRFEALADRFDEALVRALGGEHAPDYVMALLRDGLLQRVGEGYEVPPVVRDYLRQHHALDADQQDRLDAFLLRYLARHWPDERARFGPLTRDGQAWLNNARGLLARHVQTPGRVEVALIADLLAAAAPTFLAAGLAGEFVFYAEAVRDRLPEGASLARLQIAAGEALSVIGGREREAGWAFQVAASMAGLDRDTAAHVYRAYARHLQRVGETGAAEKTLSDGLRHLLAIKPPEMRLAGDLAHDWANVLAALDQPKKSVPAFEAALAAYTRAQEAERATAVQCDFAAVLARLGEFERAEDLLQRALITGRQLDQPWWQGQARRGLALLHGNQAERARRAGQDLASQAGWAEAEQYWSAALLDLLPLAPARDLAEDYQALGRVQARLGRMAEAVANLERSIRLLNCAGCEAAQAGALVVLGQVQLAHGDSVAAQQALHHALDLAARADDRALLRQVAGVLVRLHEMRASRAPESDSVFRQNTLDQASFSHAALASLGLKESAEALRRVLRDLSALPV